MIEKQKLIRMVTAVQNGEADADAVLYKACYGDIYQYILKKVNNEPLAQFLTEETFSKIFQTIGNLKEPGAFMTWSRAIAYRMCAADSLPEAQPVKKRFDEGFSENRVNETKKNSPGMKVLKIAIVLICLIVTVYLVYLEQVRWDEKMKAMEEMEEREPTVEEATRDELVDLKNFIENEGKNISDRERLLNMIGYLFSDGRTIEFLDLEEGDEEYYREVFTRYTGITDKDKVKYAVYASPSWARTVADEYGFGYPDEKFFAVLVYLHDAKDGEEIISQMKENLDVSTWTREDYVSIGSNSSALLIPPYMEYVSISEEDMDYYQVGRYVLFTITDEAEISAGNQMNSEDTLIRLETIISEVGIPE